MRQNSVIGLLALGMTLVILTGGIDLSVGALLAVAGVIAANLAERDLAIALVAKFVRLLLIDFTENAEENFSHGQARMNADKAKDKKRFSYP